MTVTSVLPEFLGSFYPLLEQLTNGRLTGNPKSPGQSLLPMAHECTVPELFTGNYP